LHSRAYFEELLHGIWVLAQRVQHEIETDPVRLDDLGTYNDTFEKTGGMPVSGESQEVSARGPTVVAVIWLVAGEGWAFLRYDAGGIG